MKKTWVWVAVLVIIIVVGYLGRHQIKSLFGMNTPTPTPVAATPTKAPSPVVSEAMKNEADFTVTGTEFKYDLSAITVKKGQTVKITFKNGGAFPHNLTIAGIAKTKTVQPGEQDTITFVADKVGTFGYKCTVDSHAEKGMTGTLTVQ